MMVVGGAVVVRRAVFCSTSREEEKKEEEDDNDNNSFLPGALCQPDHLQELHDTFPAPVPPDAMLWTPHLPPPPHPRAPVCVRKQYHRIML
ncbi:hypothetical protein E2C01_024412 [Portunus trituberculatus]|uniref:Uncharacterized protein n=1 Tax=Portunus trituberculatus TaxID=210409 RepID=A0A5B7EDR3_PORTR|nr:hypothetical protein [Portunus trituberculatus]